ncbi:MAG: sigma-70 family RNA polymerase sigma factor [Cyclobacteriaceae bacterium]
MATLKIAYSKKRDFDLWQDFKSGDRDAFDHIFYLHIDQLISYGKKITANDALIDDCIQEMFLDLWLKKERLGDTDAIKFYLLKTLRRRILVYLKKETRNDSLNTEKALDYTQDFKAILENPMTLEEKANLQEVFEKLTPAQKEVIYLKFYNNLSFDEISDVLGLKKKVLYNSLSKAMLIFRKHLKQTVLVLLAFAPFI